MKLKLLIPAVALALPGLMLARPAKNGVIEFRNPDGTVALIQLHGDENFSYATDQAGERILELNDKGFWAPAIRNGRQMTVSAGDAKLLRAEFETGLTEARLEAGVRNETRMAAIDKEGRSLFPTIGDNVHSPVVLLEYPDAPFTVPNTVETFTRMLNEEGFSDYNAKGSARDYYMASSNHKFRPIFDVYGPIRLEHGYQWYSGIEDDGSQADLIGAGKNARFGVAIKEACEELKRQGVDFSKYDYDGDGEIDNVFFFYSGYGQADSGKPGTIWPHQGEFRRYTYAPPYGLSLDPISFGNVSLGPYACSNELNYQVPDGWEQPYLDGIGAFCHEFGHVLGLPDFYDTDEGRYTKTPGYWSVMDRGSYNNNSTQPPLFSTYEQWVCRWMEFTDPEEGEHYTLPQLVDENRQSIRLRVRKNSPNVQYTSEFFILENRGRTDWDETVPEEGMVVWRVNFIASKWNTNTVNTGGTPCVEVLGADETVVPTCWAYPGEYNEFTAIYPGSVQQIVPMVTTSYWRCFVTGIEYDREKKVLDFDYNVITERHDLTTKLHDQPTRSTTASRLVYLEWDPVEGADGYLVTVTRKDSRGREYVVDGCNEKNVGLETTLTVGNISSAAFKQEFTAYVRVNQVIPSTQTSNVITFIPEELELSGVEDVMADNWNAVAVQGGILAPEGAEIYTAGGVRTGRENLPAGLYLVRFNGETRKVVVR